MFRFTIPTSRFTCADAGSTARRVDAPVRVSSLISVSTLLSRRLSSLSLKMESADGSTNHSVMAKSWIIVGCSSGMRTAGRRC